MRKSKIILTDDLYVLVEYSKHPEDFNTIGRMVKVGEKKYEYEAYENVTYLQLFEIIKIMEDLAI